MNTASPTPTGGFVPHREKQRRRLAELRAAWGQAVDRVRWREIIGLFHTQRPAAGPVVDDTTWDDLGMDEVFSAVDRTAGMPGRQVLYHQLRTYVADPAVLAERARQYEVFRRQPALREQLQLVLDRLGRPGAEYVAPLLAHPPPTPRAAPLFRLLSLATALCLAGILIFHPLVMLALVLVLTNAVIANTYGRKITPYFSGFAQIEALLGAAAELATVPNSASLPQLDQLRRQLPLIAQLRRRLGWLITDRAAQGDFAQWIFGYLNMMFLLDIVVFLRSVHLLRENQAALLEVFESVGSLDAALSVASYLDGLPSACVPTLDDSRRISVTGLYHPLIPHAVENSLELSDRGALIAGPNMAGKTAFIRTVGLNVIFAQTLNLCLARTAVLPRAIVRSAIRREDRLSEGTSYFFTEIKQVLEFTRAPADGPLHLFLIDEIYRGTNTVERLACSAAVLRHLGRRHLVFATTHDAELQGMLDDTFAMFHFSDHVSGETYGFDYLIHSGPVRSRNAIHLLKLSGYPAEITEEAERLAAQFDLGKSA